MSAMMEKAVRIAGERFFFMFIMFFEVIALGVMVAKYLYFIVNVPGRDLTPILVPVGYTLVGVGAFSILLLYWCTVCLGPKYRRVHAGGQNSAGDGHKNNACPCEPPHIKWCWLLFGLVGIGGCIATIILSVNSAEREINSEADLYLPVIVFGSCGVVMLVSMLFLCKKVNESLAKAKSPPKPPHAKKQAKPKAPAANAPKAGDKKQDTKPKPAPPSNTVTRPTSAPSSKTVTGPTSARSAKVSDQSAVATPGQSTGHSSNQPTAPTPAPSTNIPSNQPAMPPPPAATALFTGHPENQPHSSGYSVPPAFNPAYPPPGTFYQQPQGPWFSPEQQQPLWYTQPNSHQYGAGYTPPFAYEPPAPPPTYAEAADFGVSDTKRY